MNIATQLGMHITIHDDVTKWKVFPRYWPFVRGIQWSPVNSPHKGQWRGALMFSLIWINGSVNNGEAGDLRRRRAHYDVTVKKSQMTVMNKAVSNKSFLMTPWHGNVFRIIDPLWGIPPVTDGFPCKGAVMRSFRVFFDVSLPKLLKKKSVGDLGRHDAHITSL